MGYEKQPMGYEKQGVVAYRKYAVIAALVILEVIAALVILSVGY